jgi:tetratricopeptide (TPR) repeat protein
MKKILFPWFWLLVLSTGVLFCPVRAEESVPDPQQADRPQADPQPTEPIARGLDLFYEWKDEDAYRIFAEAQKEDPTLAPAGVILALLFKQEGDLRQAHKYLGRAAAESPDDPETWYRLAELAADDARIPEFGLLREKGDMLLAAFAATEAGRDSPRLRFLRSESISLAARALQEAGDLPASEAKMREYIELNPESGEGYMSLGYLLLRQGKIEEAIGQFTRAKEFAPAFFAGWLTAASLLEEERKHDDAVRLVDEHLTDADLTVADLSRLSRLLYRWGRLDDARQTVSRIPPKSLDRLKWEGLLAYSDGNAEKAEKMYREALRTAPDDFDVLNGLVLALAEQGKNSLLPEALEKANRLHRKYPLSDEAAGTLAWVEFHRGNLDRAEDILFPILNRGSLTPTSAFYLACAAIYRKNNDLARQLLGSALAEPTFYPKRTDAQKLLETIKE